MSQQYEHAPGHGLPVPRARLVAALVNEAARARIRHRVLLDVLEERGHLEVAEYVKRYEESELADFEPFVDLLLLSTQEFSAKHGDWLARNATRFGYDGTSRTNIVLSEDPVPPNSPPEPKRAKAVRKRSKARTE